MRAEIADDLDRGDLSSQIESAIRKAIVHYQSQRFFFTETRQVTFPTVAAQSEYTESDEESIPLFLGFDGVFLTVSGQVRTLHPIDPRFIERLLDNSAASGEPTRYALYEQKLRLYPIPADAYTVRLMGPIKVAAPETDDEADNAWMVHAYELIHCRAKWSLALHVLRDTDLAAAMKTAEAEALDQLHSETARKVGTGVIQATSF
jgi:hypothetical protein